MQHCEHRLCSTVLTLRPHRPTRAAALPAASRICLFHPKAASHSSRVRMKEPELNEVGQQCFLVVRQVTTELRAAENGIVDPCGSCKGLPSRMRGIFQLPALVGEALGDLHSFFVLI